METTSKQVIKAVESFVKGGDNSDLKQLDTALHQSFQNIQNGFFDKEGIFLIDKKGYLDLIAKGTFGGTPRSMEVLSIEVHGGIAMVKAFLKSELLTFTSFISLVLDKDNNWRVINNLPHVEPVKM